MLHTLLLNSNYDCLNFVTDRKIFSLIARDKVEILATWPNVKIRHGRNNQISHPSIVKLKNHAPWIPKKVKYTDRGVFRRDNFLCQYCNKALTNATATIDHIIPKVRGGEYSWKNCVTACFECNNFKKDKSLEQANMKLINKPRIPELNIISEFKSMPYKHIEWANYLGLSM